MSPHININLMFNLSGRTISGYKLQHKLGQGSFGSVYLGRRVSTNLEYALKIINRRKIMNEQNDYMRRLRLRLLRDQGNIMRECNSPHIVKCFEVLRTDEFEIMVLEYCRSGDLFKYIRDKKKLHEAEALAILRQIVRGFAELHRNKVIHRDLKSENIFIDNGVFKIGDMGMAKVLPDIMEMSRGTRLGTLYTMAPQILQKHHYGIKVDIWSLGVIFYEMLHGYTAFQGGDRKAIQSKITQGRFYIDKNNVSEKAKELIDKMLVVEQNQRMSWTELYGHPLIRGTSEMDMWACPEFYKNLQQSGMEREIFTEITTVEEKLKNQVEEETQEKVKQKVKQQQPKEQIPQQFVQSVKKFSIELQFQLKRTSILFKKLVVSIMKSEFGVSPTNYYYLLLLLTNSCCINLAAFNKAHQKQIKDLYSFKRIQEKLAPYRTLEKEIMDARKKLKNQVGSSTSLFKKNKDILKKIFTDYENRQYGMGELVDHVYETVKDLVDVLKNRGDKQRKYVSLVEEYQSLLMAQVQYDQDYIDLCVDCYL